MKIYIIMIGVFIVAVAAIAVLVVRCLQTMSMKADKGTEDILNNVANNTDVLIVLYSYKDKKVQYVSESIKWLFGIERDEIYKDVSQVFRLLGFSLDDEVVTDFQKGNIQLFVQKEYELTHATSGQSNWIHLNIVPYKKGRYLLLAKERTIEHELSETLLVTLGAVDELKKEKEKLQIIMEQKEKEHIRERALFEKPQIEAEHTLFAENETEQKQTYHGRRILLVEDNELNMELACKLLENTGVEIDTAVNGEEAVQLFEVSQEGYYELVLMDIQMPVMDGNVATRKIRAMERKDAKVIPIVAMTAYIFAEDIRVSLRAGMDMHIAKPLDTEKLMGVMNKYLAKTH